MDSGITTLTSCNIDIAIALSADGIAAIDNALGRQFAVGGSANTDIPEPPALHLLIPALLGIQAIRHRACQTSKRSALS